MDRKASLLHTYLLSKKHAWAKESLRASLHTLTPLLPHLNGDPEKLWRVLESRGMAPYARVTTWSRVCTFWDYYQLTGGDTNETKKGNPYRKWRHDNARSFKNCYERQIPTLSVADARELIEKEINDPPIRKKALELLLSGMRWRESFTYKNGRVVGKGGKRRYVFLPEIHGPGYSGSYVNFLRKLRAGTGLKPHDLRKIYLNQARKNGADVFSLKKIAGWSDIRTALHYIDDTSDSIDEIGREINKASGERRRKKSS